MRNYVIINGTNSLTIKGLAINIMPPISKPTMRTLREEIDGRDGDIVTELGYQAYDKMLEIGLYGSYDINEIIAFFNQKGTIVFSDEADKYYNFQILEKIDYTSLQKFRTATITIHCQPFKYPLNETPIEIQNEYLTGEGTNLTLQPTKQAPMQLDLKGNTSQNGTPTPSSPVDINVVSGDNTIYVEGKNLINMVEVNRAVNNSGTISGNNTIYLGVEDYIPVQPNTTYTITFEHDITIEGIGKANLYVGEKKKDGTFISRTPYLANRTFTTSGETYYIFPYLNRTGFEFTTIGGYIQLEKGNSSTPYEPYTGTTYPINLGSIELCKIGTYQDYIYKDNGSWYLHKEIGKVVLDGTETSWAYSSANENFNTRAYYLGMKNTSTSTGYIPKVCNYFNYYASNGNRSGLADGIYENSTNEQISFLLFHCNSLNITTLADWITWLSTNKPIIYYVLETPTNTEITDTTLISQLEETKESQDGTTNISQENNDMPFIISASALKEGSGEATITNEGNIYSKPTIELEGTGNVQIYLDGSQAFEVDMSEENNITIDTDKMEAYNPTDNTLANRKVTGDYSKFKLNVGDNEMSIGGDITKATITNYTRWL